MGKILPISPKRNFTSNTLGSHGLTSNILVDGWRKKSWMYMKKTFLRQLTLPFNFSFNVRADVVILQGSLFL